MTTTTSPAETPTALTPDPLPPGPTGPGPLVFANVLFRPGSFLEGARDRFGTPFTVRLSAQRTIVITDDPAVIKQVFTSDPTKLLAGEGDDYLDAVIKESLRLRPVVPAVARYITEPTELGGRVYPAGVHINPSIYLTHYNPDIYPEPEQFRPERFIEKPAGTYEWIPFGGGTRRCLGATFALFEMKIVLGELLRDLDLETTSEKSERIARRAITFSPGRNGRIAIRDRATAPGRSARPARA